MNLFVIGMTRTRGASTYQIESYIQGEGRRIPTTLARRRGHPEEVGALHHHDLHEEQKDVIEEQRDVEQHKDVVQEQHEVGEFLGSPHDTLLLTRYVNHVAFTLW